MISFQWITLSFLLVSAALFAYLIPHSTPYTCNNDADVGSRFIYSLQVIGTYQYTDNTNLRKACGWK